MSSSHPRRSDVFRTAVGPAVDSLVRAGPHLQADEDAASVHAARVAARRLRSDLRLFRPMLDRPWLEHVRAGLKRLGGALGAVRDTDVIAERVAALAKRLPAERSGDLARIAGSLRTVHAAACETLRSETSAGWYAELLATLLEAVRDGRHVTMPGARMCRRAVVTAIVQPAWKKLERAVRRAGAGDDPVLLHRIRIRAKNCRYAAEAIAPFVGRGRRRRLERFMRHIVRLQDRLGIVHDIVLERQALGAIAGLDRTVVAEIDALETASANILIAAWRASWNELDRRRARFW